MFDAWLTDYLLGGDEISIDEQNEISSYLYALSKESAGKLWWDAEIYHPAVGRALRIDRADQGGVYALAPFRLAKIEERHLIIAAWPAPRILGPVDGDWLDIEQVIAWDPVKDETFLIGQSDAQLVGSFDNGSTLFGDTHSFFVTWAQKRAEYFQLWLDTRKGEWSHPAPERDDIPGCLVVGNPDAIKWAPSSMPQNLSCAGIDAGRINRLLLKSANVPRAHNLDLRIAA